MTDSDDKELKATDAGVDGRSSDESVAIEPKLLLDSKAEPPAAIPPTTKPATNILRRRREANPFKESTLVLPVRQEFYHSKVHEERNVEYYLHWVYSTSTIDVQRQCPAGTPIRPPRTIRSVGIVISRRLMAGDTKLTQSEESPVENAAQRNRSFEGLENAEQERPGFLWFLGYRIEAWVWYSKGWKVRNLKRWLKEHEHEHERGGAVLVRPMQSSGDSVTLALENEISLRPEQMRDGDEPTEASLPAQQLVVEESDHDSLNTHESADTITAADQTISTRIDFYSHPGVGLHSDSASQSESSSTASASPPPSPPPSTLRRTKSLADLRSPVKPPPQLISLDPPRPQRFHTCLDVIGEDNEDEPPTSPDIASSDAFTSTSPETTSSVAIVSHNDSGGEELATLHSQQTTHAVSPSDARGTKFHEELHSSSNAETSEATLHAASAIQDSNQREGELEIVVTHSVSSGIKMRLERLAKSLKGADGGKRPSGRSRRDAETAGGSATSPDADRGGGLRRSLSRRLSSQSKRLSGKGE